MLCRRGDDRVAIEIQMSRQTLAEYRRRQEIYASSGVRGIWFAGHKGFDRNWSTPDLPIFPIRLKDLEAEVEPARGRQVRLPVERFVAEFLDNRWHCRQPTAAPATIIPELAVCADCGREVLAGHTIAAYPAEADPVYPPGPIFAYLTDVLHEGSTVTRAAWNKHGIIVLGRDASACPYCDGRLRYARRFTPETLCKAQHGVQDRHGAILLTAGGWWRRGEPLVPRHWTRSPRIPSGGDIPIAAIVERQRHRLPPHSLAPLILRERVLAAIRSAVDDLDDWTAEAEYEDLPRDRGDDPWLADIVLRETGMSQGGRRIAFFLAVGPRALEDRRTHARRAKKADFEAVVLNPTTEIQPFANHPAEVLLSGGDRPVVTVGAVTVPLAQFAADLVRSRWVVRSSAKVPFTLVPVPASCPSCGREGTMEGFMALHFGEADIAFGEGMAIMPVTKYQGLGGYASQTGGRNHDITKSLTCLCGEGMASSITAEAVLAHCGDLQVRDGLWHCPVGPWVRRGSVPLPDKALGLVAGNRAWTRETWLAHAGQIAPPPDSDAVRLRRSLLSSILRGANATGWLVDESHVDQGVVLVHCRGASRLAIVLLSTVPGKWADQRQDAEVKAADAVLKKVQAEETFWLTVMPHPTLPRGHDREPITIGMQDAACALPASHDVVPLGRFVTDLLEGGWEYLRQQPLTLSLVPERVRCPTCGKTSHIAPWCAAKASGRLAPSFARILGQPDGKMRLLPLDTAESLRRSAGRQLRMPPFEKRDGAVVQSCGHCGRVLASALTTETLRRHWTGPGVGHLETSIDLNRWCRLAEPILAGSLTVPGRLDASRLTLEQWLSAIAPQQSLL